MKIYKPQPQGTTIEIPLAEYNKLKAAEKKRKQLKHNLISAIIGIGCLLLAYYLFWIQ